MLTEVTPQNYMDFCRSKPYALLLWDAQWNKHKGLRGRLEAISDEYPGDDFAFGVADVDVLVDVAKELTLNVPAITYIAGSPVKTVIGEDQNIKEQVRWFLEDVANGWM